MIGRGRAILRRVAQVGPRVLGAKVRQRLWSTRVAMVVARDTAPGPASAASVALSFTVAPTAEVARELDPGALRGADRLYVEALVRIFGGEPGVAIVGRTAAGTLVSVGLMSCAEHHAGLEAAAPGLYPRVPADTCWTEAHFVVPDLRGKRVMGLMLAAERAYLHERGIRRVNAMIDVDNVASLRAFAREGYLPTGSIRSDRYRFNRRSSTASANDATALETWRVVVDEVG